MTKYLIYKTTNLVNGKIYIGQHVCNHKNCKYFGSGDLILKALKKYGKENFVREVLFECSSEDELNEKEAEIVTEDFVKEETNYNVYPGGIGPARGRRLTEDQKTKIRNYNLGKTLSNEHKEKISKGVSGKKLPQWHKDLLIEASRKRKGKTLSEDHKRNISQGILNSEKYENGKSKISESSKNRIWVNDGVKTYFLKEEEINPNIHFIGRIGLKKYERRS